MKKSLFLLLTVLCFFKLTAQKKIIKKEPTLTLSLILNDYKTVQNIHNTSLTEVIRKGRVSAFSQMSPGAAITYFRGVSNHIDFSSSIGGSFIDSAIKGSVESTKNVFLLETDANLIAKVFSDKRLIVPFLITGLGASIYDGKFGVYNPSGGGMQMRVGDGSFFIAELQYRLALTDSHSDHLYFSVCFGGRINRRKRTMKNKLLFKETTTTTTTTINTSVEKDSDEDGIVDSKDKCINIKGVLKYEGCPIPDTDGDGLNDEVDRCPQDSGSIRYNGCPVPDSDKDGLSDEEDNCPYTAGLPKYKGCPIPDTDGDGINDEMDHCITQKGPLKNFGCPVKAEIISQLIQLSTRIYFATGSAELLQKSFEPLNKVASILREDSTIMLEIEGHTDNVGSKSANEVLSRKRAEAILQFLSDKAINVKRLRAIGYGETIPLASNDTKEGRSKNRRVELKIRTTP